ncbi:MAG: hypothetical protein AB9856_18235 [Cellulosilyticaceae bacterium]
MACSYKDGLRVLENHKVIIHSGRCRYCVILSEVCGCYLKTIELGNGNVRTFNLDRVDYIEELLPC